MANHYFRISIVWSEASLTTSRQANSLVLGGKEIPSSPVKDDDGSALLALIDYNRRHFESNSLPNFVFCKR